MRKLLAKLVIALGIAVASFGLIGTPFIQDMLPLDIFMSVDGQGAHKYVRLVPTASQGPEYFSYLFLFAGAMLLIFGVVSHRRLRGNAA